MAKDRKESGGSKPSGRGNGHRPRREDYVNSFRWDFVDEGGSKNDNIPDEDLFFGEPADYDFAEEPFEASKAVAKRTKESAPQSSAKERSATKSASSKERVVSKSGEKPSSRKSDARPSKTVAVPVPSPFEEDDDDLSLPSYGRTPIPTDHELPQRSLREKADKKAAPSAKPVREQSRSSVRSSQQEQRDQSREELSLREQRSSEESTARPRREQMVWDPDKREYVPLIVPEKKPRQQPTAPVAASPKREPVKKASEPPKKETAPRRESEFRQEKPTKSEQRPSASRPATSSAQPPAAKQPVRLEKVERVEKAERVEKVEKKPKREPRREARSEPRSEPRSESREDHPQRRPTNEKERDLRSPQRGGVQPFIESQLPDPADVEAESTGFAKLGVSETMLEALKVVRYLEPTPIQAGVFKQVQAGRDVMGQAQTGTGKTAAFSIPILEGVEECPPGNDPVALILVPTRELAVQVRDEALRLAYGRDIRITACYGGKPLAKQIARLKDGVDVIVGTPGRILDLLNRRALTFDALHWVVLDEADRMLDIGFRPDIEKILKRTPESRQTLLFSATLPQPVVRLAEKYMREPEVLDFSNKGVAVETIEQFYVTVDPERKFDALVYLLNEQQPNQAIIFTRTKRGADRLARLLSKQFKSLAAIHGDLSQNDRDRVMGQFRAGTLRYLVATDVVGRGIDVSGISHIINYDIPTFCDDYVHRVGRTGRMGREGVAFTFVTVQEGAELTRIEMRINKLLKRAELKGFESFTKPTDPEATLEDDGEPRVEAKPVYGKPIRKIRRAL